MQEPVYRLPGMHLLRGSVKRSIGQWDAYFQRAAPSGFRGDVQYPSQRIGPLPHRPEAHPRCRFAIPAVVVPYALTAVRIEALPVILHTSPELRVVDIDALLYACPHPE